MKKLIEEKKDRGFIHGVFDAKEKYNKDNAFQKIPKEEFEAGISDTAASYQSGYIAGIERGKEQERSRLLEEIEKKAFLIKHGGAIDLDISPVVKLDDINQILKI